MITKYFTHVQFFIQVYLKAVIIRADGTFYGNKFTRIRTYDIITQIEYRGACAGRLRGSENEASTLTPDLDNANVGNTFYIIKDIVNE